MKKRIISLALAAVMLLSLFAGTGALVPEAHAAEGTITVKLHYNRPDGNYEGWNLWFWDPDGTTEISNPNEMVKENGEMVATVNLKPGTTRLGYIVRLNEWEQKDIEQDQFIEIAGVLSGTIHVYVESGVVGHKIVFGDDVVEGVTVVAAKYIEDDGVVRVQCSSPLEYEAVLSTFTVKNADGTVPVTKIKAVDNYYYLTVGELDLSRTYSVILEDMEYDIVMPDYYANAEFEKLYTYTGDDLGATYSKEKTVLRVWAPTALQVHVNLYSNGDPAAQPKPDKQVAMTKDVQGTWVVTLDGDMNGTYYTYSVTMDTEVNEACDPYARTTGVNGKRAMIIDLDSTDPEGWDNDKDPHYDNNFTDAIIYELHIRDLSSDSSSGIKNVGKYLGLIETGTTNANGISTGLDHIKNLGVTHIHLLPVYDFGSVNESTLDKNPNQFNWGYDPVNYNVPEGSYSTDPFNGEVRVKEFKQMVKGLHDNGISVIMDVVYNHVYDAGQFCFNNIVPGYFSRPGSNGSGCGNDTASERVMVSKYIVDSVKYWADEYHIDGFRFDLVGLIDTATINAVIEEVHKTHPNVKFYGEGWTMSTITTKPNVTMTTQTNARRTPEFAFFSDTFRDLLKGGVFDTVSLGYVSGAKGQEFTLKDCFKGMPSWCPSPSQTINYASCHDNYTLIDRIVVSTPKATWADQVKMNNLAAAIYMTSQGIPFMQAGEEILRSKPLGDGTYDHNSYNKPDSINSIKWNDLEKAEYMDTYNYYKGLIAFRKAHPALRLTDANSVYSTVTDLADLAANVVGFHINGSSVEGETAESIYVIFNANTTSTTVTLPEGNWNAYITGEDAGVEPLSSHKGSVEVAPISAMVLIREDRAVAAPADPSFGINLAGILGGIAVAAAAAISAAVIISKDRKKESN